MSTLIEPEIRPVREGEEVAPAARRRRRRIRRQMGWWSVAVLILGIPALMMVARAHQGKAAPKNLHTARVTHMTIVETVTATGSVTAQTGAQVKIGSQVTGRIRRLYADVGGHVNAGQIIAELDAPDLQAQIDQASSTLAQASTHYQQQEAGVGMEQTQTRESARTAQEGLEQAVTRQESALMGVRLQSQQTQDDIRRAQASLYTARAQEVQQERSHDQQIAAAAAAARQAEATEKNAASNLRRIDQLFRQGFSAANDVDNAQSQEEVASAQVESARQNLSVTRAKADADQQAAKEQVAQSEAALDAAKAEKLQDVQKQQDLRSAESAVRQSRSQLTSAAAGSAQDVLKLQDVKQAQEAVQQARAQLTYQDAQMDKTSIRSPISGTVIQLAAQQGETVAAGLAAPTLIVVANLDLLQVDAYVDETDIGRVHVGQEAGVTVDSFPDKVISGTVVKIASSATTQSNVVTYDVTVTINNTEHLLKPDMTTSVTIKVGSHPDVVAVPNEALKAGKTSTYVWVMAPGKPIPQQRPVQAGATDGTNTEIVSGLDKGETIVLAGWSPDESSSTSTPTPFGGPPAGGPPPGAGASSGGGGAGSAK